MKKKTYYHIILDQSGSMQDCIQPTISGFNEQLQMIQSLQQRFSDQELFLGLTRFNHEVLHTYFAKDPHAALPLDRQLYTPNGSTALYDAIGTTVLKLKEAILPELQQGIASAVVVILTDGYENASRLFTLAGIRHLIEELEATGLWTFSYLGATLDAVAVATDLRIKSANAMAISKEQMADSYRMLGRSMQEFMEERGKGRAVKNFLKKDDI